jgi:DNA-binding transcriptional MerR regulator
MGADAYTLAQLARLADVTPRTVRYYVQQGLLPGPDRAGPATRYDDRHLRRLRLIRRLQREHLPLATIRERLELLEDWQIEAALDDETGIPAVAPPMSTDETLALVRQLMARAGVSPRFYDNPEPSPADGFGRRVPDEFPVREPPAPASPTPGSPVPEPRMPAPPPGTVVPPILPLEPSAAPRTTGRSTWERISITPDVEIHVRGPLDRSTNRHVDQLIERARELFAEDR